MRRPGRIRERALRVKNRLHCLAEENSTFPSLPRSGFVQRIGLFPQSRRESRWRKAGSLRIGEHCGRNAVGRNRGGAMGIEWTSSLVLSHVAGECEVAGELARQESAGL